jgi:hypothetical protein
MFQRFSNYSKPAHTGFAYSLPPSNAQSPDQQTGALCKCVKERLAFYLGLRIVAALVLVPTLLLEGGVFGYLIGI